MKNLQFPEVIFSPAPPAAQNAGRMESEMILNEAILEAGKKVSGWRGGAVVVKTDDGYEAYPASYMNNITFTGSRDVVVSIDDAHELFGGDHTLLSDEQLLDYIDENVIPYLEND